MTFLGDIWWNQNPVIGPKLDEVFEIVSFHLPLPDGLISRFDGGNRDNSPGTYS